MHSSTSKQLDQYTDIAPRQSTTQAFTPYPVIILNICTDHRLAERGGLEERGLGGKVGMVVVMRMMSDVVYLIL